MIKKRCWPQIPQNGDKVLSVDLFGAGAFAFLPTPRCICHHQLPLHCRWPSDPAASLTKLHDKTG